MKNSHSDPHRDLFRRTFLTMSLLSAVPLLAVLLLLFAFVFHSSEKEMLAESRNALQEYIKEVDAQILTARVETIKLATSPETISFIINPTFDLIDRNSNIMKQLHSVTSSYGSVDSAYIYSRFSRLVLTSEMRGYRQLQFTDDSALELYSNQTPGRPFEIRKDPRYGVEDEYFISIYQNIPVSSADTLGCVIVNLPADSLLSSFPVPFAKDLSVYSKDGELLYSGSQDISYQSDPGFADALSGRKDAFVFGKGADRRMVLTAQSALTGMQFIASQQRSFFPWNQSRAFLFSILLSAAAISAAVALSFLYARRLTAPVADLMLEMRPVLKRDLFKNLLLNGEQGRPVARDLALIGEDFGKEGYAAVIFMIPNRETYLKENDEAARAQHETMLRTLMDESVNGQYPYAVNKMHRCFWVLSLNIASEAALARLRSVIASAVTELPFPVAFECGPVCDGPEDLHISYKEAVDKMERTFHTEKEKASPASKSGSVHAETPSAAGQLAGGEKAPDAGSPAEALPEEKEKPLSIPKLSPEEAGASGGSIEKMIAYINAHLSEDISLQNLADMCGISPSYVSRLFRERLDIGFVEYLNTLRVRRAQKLLSETEQSVEKIGQAVGFNNNRSFIRTFKQYCGLTPGQYRAKQNKE